MKSIEKLVDEVYNSSKIPFQLIIDEVGEYISPKFYLDQDSIERKFDYQNTKCCIKVNAAFSVTIDLLEFCLVDRLKSIFLQKEDIISSLLNGEGVDRVIINTCWPVINEKFTLVNVYIENYNEEVYSYIDEVYRGSNIESIVYNNNILMFGRFEDVKEHAISIIETVGTVVSGKCYVSYCEVEDYRGIKKSYEDTIYSIGLAIKYNLEEGIFDAKKLMLEGIIDSVSEEVKDEVYNAFNDGMSKLDNEMFRTIDVFFRCGLNLSEAAKELYIHRNTLIYRLDKIQKYTNYDIRDFNSAILLKIIFFIWKEKRK